MECPSCKALKHTCPSCVQRMREKILRLEEALKWNQEGWNECQKKYERQIRINEAAFALLKALGE